METIKQYFVNYIYDPFMGLVNKIAIDDTKFYILIGLFFVFLIVGSGKFKKPKIVNSILSVAGTVTVLVLLATLYVRYYPIVSDYIKKATTTSPSTSPTSGSGTKKTPSQQQAPTYQQPTYQQPKQLYYAVSCSGCYAEGCARNGYSYGGYNYGYYSYYYSLCKSCSCTSFKAQSLWR